MNLHQLLKPSGVRQGFILVPVGLHAAAAVVVGRPETGGTPENPRGIPVFR